MKKFYLETYGCKLNQSDSELIKGILKEEFKEVSSPNEADFIIINSCGVVEKTERKIIKRIKSFGKKKVILAGCLPIINQDCSRELVAGIIGPKDIPLIKEAINNVLKGEKFFKISKKRLNKAKFFPLKERKRNKVSAIVPIAEGCLGNCTFCITKKARGKLNSFKMEDILKEIELLVSTGYKEIQLTSQDAILYGLDKGEFLLPELLNKITKIEGDFKVRVGMMNPSFTKKATKDLIKVFRSDKIYKFLHLPLQSGDDGILKEMKRQYEVEDFLTIVKEFRKNFKDSLIATDIIVGYPGESEEAFENTFKVVKDIKPEIVHIFRFSKRDGTKAALLKDFPDRIKKERSRALTKLCREINLKENKKFLGKKFEVLVAEKRKNNFIGRLPSFRAVILKEGKLGEFQKVRISDFRKNYLVGEKI